MDEIPKIRAVTAIGPYRLLIAWAGGTSEDVDLMDWIASGGILLSSLDDPNLFNTARVEHHGFAVVWGSDTEDLAIDAYHLRLIAEAQRSKRYA